MFLSLRLSVTSIKNHITQLVVWKAKNDTFKSSELTRKIPDWNNLPPSEVHGDSIAGFILKKIAQPVDGVQTSLYAKLLFRS